MYKLQYEKHHTKSINNYMCTQILKFKLPNQRQNKKKAKFTFMN